ncbi:1-(5-phosphoribosyl)-5- ((5-phosphoribosylamino)methylideneamino)imidazole-4-carboxamide isomerase [Saccharolobus solfataricus]|uniref:1-(5-phosphoribosyl)-5-[(5-phosphoribosylamino)methylideneamino] imidazole-4-carboxamide isomerase n=3 Tax=Saccharolobus solfataricus TaxID=2287 RepID=HIS4_SACS2|nr:1-(5-phosphoribosyl)-5-((5-phosphoribosylamino)methylideneamino)imidazole-4-carboxamide isomerase [Saccharolobus solfataricus]O33772.1 RecName: Full=1-(5-phosphoribosyl)-5-[(5-phosphoribosylamino)methylideneamino] imidazole-4-carboxamide isomerase; AltName: Full=Phosphoribosylformimino-5-aminoimidazole carboxamide ribotide isomerase [Saccharolobus solfataricus P2]AAB63020.1 phosphoribosyl-formimino-5-amino-1-phosphoribosyl-4-imidazole carboxamide isomerase [Saccharolobus solfataricus P2]AAK40
MNEIIPSIDISFGKAVKRIRGVRGTGLVLGNPIELANKLYNEGYSRIHVVDLDAAEGVGNNEMYIKEICKIGFDWIQVGGGIRDVEKAKRLISLDVNALIFSTIVFTNFNLFYNIVREIGNNRVIVSIDYDDTKRVLISGWKERSMEIIDGIKKVNELELLGIILTYVTNEGTVKGIDYSVKDYAKLIRGVKEYAGGVSSDSDITFLKNVGFDYIIVGMAFYLNKIRGTNVV